MTKREETKFEGKDPKRNKEGWKAQLRNARKGKAKRQKTEGAWK